MYRGITKHCSASAAIDRASFFTRLVYGSLHIQTYQTKGKEEKRTF